MKKWLITVVGPTAIGKTPLAIALAKHFNTEVISSDSRQFYKEMGIGTAVPTPEELEEVKHHCIQHLSIFDHYSVAEFEKECLQILEELFRKKDVAVLVGGSGLYMDAVLYGLDHFPEVPSQIREDLNMLLQKEGIEALQQQLSKLDPVYYQKVDIHNPHRLIRALEVCIASGKPYSSFLGNRPVKRPFHAIILGISADRNIVYDRINRRVEVMLEKGLVEEARRLYPYRDRNALQTVGYKELFAHFDGKISLAEAVAEIKKNTRRFAKRQLTWYRKNEKVIWFEYDLPYDLLVERVERLLKDSNP